MRHVRPRLGLGIWLPLAQPAPSWGPQSCGALGLSGWPGPAVQLLWGRAPARVGARGLPARPRMPDSEGVGVAGEPVRSAAGAASVPFGREAPGPPYLPGRRPRAGCGESSGGRGSGPGRPAGEVRRGAEGGSHRV